MKKFISQLFMMLASAALIAPIASMGAVPSSGIINAVVPTSRVQHVGDDMSVILKNSMTFSVNSVAGLRSISKLKYAKVETTGYYLIGDGGAAKYYFDSADTSSADNGCTVITGADGGRWKIMVAGSITIKQCGAKGDGVTSDTVAVQTTVDSGYPVYVPVVAVGYRLTAPVNITKPVRLLGDGTQPFTVTGPYNVKGAGSWFFVDHAGVGFNIGNGGFLTTVRIEKIGTYRNHVTAIAPGWTPTVFDFDFIANNTDIIYDDIMMLNAYRGISHVNGNGGRVTINNVRGQWFNVGINIDKALDTVRMNNVHMWPFWSNDANVTNYQQANTTFIALNRTDNPMLSNLFSIYSKINLGIYQNVDGTVSKLRVDGMDADFSQYPIYIDATVNSATAQFVNLTTYGPSAATANNYGVRIMGSYCRFEFVNFEGSNLSRGLLKVDGTGNTVRASGIRVNTWDRLTVGAPVIDIATGNIVHINDEMIAEGGSATTQIYSAGVLKYKIVREGVATIASGTTSVVITHGMPTTPTAMQIQATMLTGLGAAKGIWVDAATITATQFTIRTNVDPTAAISIAWRVSLE